MKKLILSAVIGLVALTSQAQQLAFISGKFTNHMVASYSLYELNANNEYTEIKSVTNKRKFEVECEVDKNYLIKFTDKDNDVKYMSFVAHQEGDIAIDVDFKSKKSISMVYEIDKATIKKLTEPLVFTQK